MVGWILGGVLIWRWHCGWGCRPTLQGACRGADLHGTGWCFDFHAVTLLASSVADNRVTSSLSDCRNAYARRRDVTRLWAVLDA